MSIAMRAAPILLASLVSWPAGAQMLGPTWETDVVLTKSDIGLIERALEQQLLGHAVGTVAAWRNPSTGHFGTLKLDGEFLRSGLRCARIGYMIAAAQPGVRALHLQFNVCVQPDGSWKFA